MKKVAIAVSEFNSIITDKLLSGALKEAKYKNFQQVRVFRVPGALELPFIAQSIAKTKKYSAIVLLGCIIKGETDHYEYVCMQVSQGIQYVMLKYHIPIICGILTTKDMKQALDRVGGLKGHKGQDAIKAALKMYKIEQEIKI